MLVNASQTSGQTSQVLSLALLGMCGQKTEEIVIRIACQMGEVECQYIEVIVGGF